MKKTLVLILLFALAFSMVSCSDKSPADESPSEDLPSDESPVVNERGNTSGNIANGGLAAIQGEWI